MSLENILVFNSLLFLAAYRKWFVKDKKLTESKEKERESEMESIKSSTTTEILKRTLDESEKFRS